MATRKTAASARKSTAARKKAAPVAKKTTVRTVAASASKTNQTSKSVFSDNLINILLAELVGTFVLTSVAIMTVSNVLPLYVGLTMVVLVFIVGGVSGAHVNPAVTFGLWSARKLRSVLVPFYWVAQFIGAMAAVLILNAVSGTKVALDFAHFGTFDWPIFFVELVGAAVFLFGVVSVVSRSELTQTAKAFGVGLSLFIGLLVSGTLIAGVNNHADTSKIGGKQDANGHYVLSNVPHTVRVTGATLNPAIALAATEDTDTQVAAKIQGQGNVAPLDTETLYSRLSWEVILATLVGAALGANLALLVAYRFRS